MQGYVDNAYPRTVHSVLTVTPCGHCRSLRVRATLEERSLPMDTTRLRRTTALIASAALLASLTVVTVAAPVAAAATCDGKPATIVGGGLIDGTNGNDVIVGSNGDDHISGLGGKDTICGRGGNDAIDGGGKRDRIFGGSGDDVIAGGGGGEERRPRDWAPWPSRRALTRERLAACPVR